MVCPRVLGIYVGSMVVRAEKEEITDDDPLYFQ